MNYKTDRGDGPDGIISIISNLHREKYQYPKITLSDLNYNGNRSNIIIPKVTEQTIFLIFTRSTAFSGI